MIAKLTCPIGAPMATAEHLTPDWHWDEILIVARYVEDNGGKALGNGSRLNAHVQNLLNKATIHPEVDGRRVVRTPGAVKRKSGDLESVHPDYRGVPTNGGQTTREVLNYWLANPATARKEAIELEEMIERGELMHLPDDDQDASATEGKALLVRHLRRERNAALREKKIRRAKTLDCEVCGINFGHVYGDRGEGYIEVHHTLPLHVSGETTTRLNDLALLCSNCHRMIHRTPWTTPEGLRAQLASD